MLRLNNSFIDKQFKSFKMDQYHEQRVNSTVGQKYQISGSDCQVLTVAMGGGDKVMSQPGMFKNLCFIN